MRINLAGPRPDQMQQQLGLLQNDYLPQLQGVAWPGQQQQPQQQAVQAQQQALQAQQQALPAQQGAAWPVSPGKLASGTSAQFTVSYEVIVAPLYAGMEKGGELLVYACRES